MQFSSYQTEGFYDEMFEDDGRCRPHVQLVMEVIQSLSDGQLLRYKHSAERLLLQLGITFNVYGDTAGAERIFPFDLIPRVIPAGEWDRIERGLKQRVHALNAFIDDIYHGQKILKDGAIPTDVVTSAVSYRQQCHGLNPPWRVWCHITGTDLVRDRDGCYYVLEDNLRVPSGVSYVLENREVLKRIFPRVFEGLPVRPVNDYTSRLLEMLESIAPHPAGRPRVVLLTPGIYNSAYFEHSFLAQQMGVQLVEGHDLVVQSGDVFMRTTKGLERVDVIYRRVDDDFLDPQAFRPDSLLGVPGLMDVYRAGRVALANAPGNGVADDKVIYAYVPEMIRYYEDADPILPNVPTYLCWRDSDRQYVLEHLDELVVKSANESGGYGMLVGPHSTRPQQDEFAVKIRDNPRNFIAQPTLALSRVPTIVDDHFEGRHVDLRPYVLCGKEIFVLPGGLTRVAMRQGSLVVNSSQGGGSKDTWVLAEAAELQTADLQTGGQQQQQS
ncbi:MAG TPA: circularly permuted type 2 ATP-grasp protein [Candidatus Acidoferrales bacterium]|nr:circularly permuted type 2 ATP-grasp protein [Candidatus Acidoferrales bacterium]